MATPSPAWHGDKPAYTPAHFRSLQSLVRSIAMQLLDVQSALEEGQLSTRCGPRLSSASDAAETEQFSLFRELGASLQRLQALLDVFQGAAVADHAAGAALQAEEEHGAIAAYWQSLITDDLGED